MPYMVTYGNTSSQQQLGGMQQYLTGCTSSNVVLTYGTAQQPWNQQQWVCQPDICYPVAPDYPDERENKKADERAEILLLSCLTKEQSDSYKSGKWFDVKTERHHYRIHRGRAANVAVLDSRGREQRRLCAHPTMSVPDCDTMLVQKLMLEYDETKFLATANVHPAR